MDIRCVKSLNYEENSEWFLQTEWIELVTSKIQVTLSYIAFPLREMHRETTSSLHVLNQIA